MNWTTSFLWWPQCIETRGPMCAIPSTEGPPAPFAGRAPAPGPRAARQLRPGVRQVARQLVQVDERLRCEHEVDTTLQFLEAEPALREVPVDRKSTRLNSSHLGI